MFGPLARLEVSMFEPLARLEVLMFEPCQRLEKRKPDSQLGTRLADPPSDGGDLSEEPRAAQGARLEKNESRIPNWEPGLRIRLAMAATLAKSRAPRKAHASSHGTRRGASSAHGSRRWHLEVSHGSSRWHGSNGKPFEPLARLE
jgi:hypothetical protein